MVCEVEKLGVYYPAAAVTLSCCSVGYCFESLEQCFRTSFSLHSTSCKESNSNPSALRLSVSNREKERENIKVCNVH